MQNGSNRRAGRLSDWRRDLRAYVVRRGIRAVCGTSEFESETLAADVPLVRAGLRMAWLRALSAIGVNSIVATSGLGHKFVCHAGDLAEYPFYHRHAYRKELELCAAWLRRESEPVMYDVGANDGFFSSQIAQMMTGRPVRIYALEPVPTTFAKLVQSISRLGLEDRIQPIAAAVVEESRLVLVGYSHGMSLLSQVVRQEPNARVAKNTALCAGITLDELCFAIDKRPGLLKIDVEGGEVNVLRGARKLLSGSDRPAISMEFSPFTLEECGESPKELCGHLEEYLLFYIDDHYGQRMPFGTRIHDVEEIRWTCNLFAVPAVEGADARWASALEEARHRLDSRPV